MVSGHGWFSQLYNMYYYYCHYYYYHHHYYYVSYVNMVVSLAVVSQNPGASWLVDGYPQT